MINTCLKTDGDYIQQVITIYINTDNNYIHKDRRGIMHYNCLVVDDEEELAKATCEYFQMFDTSCQWVSNSVECISFLEENTVDVLLLDINLKDESGFALCKTIRESWDVPILFISARQSDDDILIALNIGGDDYIKKPYTLSVLLAKVKVIIRRNGTNKSICNNGNGGEASSTKAGKETNAYSRQDGKASGMKLNPANMRVLVGGKEVELKAKEYKLFEYMYENPNRIITKDELFNAVWGDTFFSDGTLNVHIRRLREKLEKNPNEPELIKTVWGTGYILEI